MWQKLQTYVVVTLIAVLIWLLAELRTVKEHDLLMDVVFVAPPGQQLVVEPATPRPVRVTLLCPTGQLDQIQDMLRGGPIEVEVGDDPTISQQQVNLAEALASYRPLQSLGVRVVETQPENVQVRVEGYVEQTLPIVVDAGTRMIRGIPSTDPGQVTVQMPAGLARDLTSPAAHIRLNTLDFSQYEQNVPITLDLPVELPPTLRDPHVTVRPRSAKVTFAIEKQTTTTTLPNVPILALAPPSELERFDVELAEEHRVLREVKLSGPPDVITRIENKEITVWAQFRLTTDDLERGVTTAPLTIVVPQGVTVEEPPGSVNLTITRRE